MASAASRDFFYSLPERVQRIQSQASGPCRCRIGETVYPDDLARWGLAASRLSGYDSGICRDVDSPVAVESGVTMCASRCDSEDLSVRGEDTKIQSPAWRDST